MMNLGIEALLVHAGIRERGSWIRLFALLTIERGCIRLQFAER
jgi:hypothetical protein